MKTSIEEAKATVNRHALAPTPTRLPITEAAGLRLADDVAAPEPLPSFDNSAMDGYAVRLPERDDPIAEPFPILGEAQAGSPFEGHVGPGQAVRISTGAVVPDGAERVIRIEDAEEENGRVRFHEAGTPNGNIRYKGEEVAVGDGIAEKGAPLTPPLVGRLASLGVAEVPVYEPPTVAVLNTGNELVDAGAALKPGQIRNSNRYVLTDLLRRSGARLGPVETVRDTWDDTVAAIEHASERADLVVITGGVSVGPHDHVKAAAEEVGFERRFWKVRQKPGKPFYFATREDTLLFGLPGNPFSAAINTVYYVRPVVRRALGIPRPEGRTVAARMHASHERRKARRAKFMLVRIVGVEDGEARLRVVDKQRSHMLAGLHESDGFVLGPVGKTQFAPTEPLEMTLFPWREERAMDWGLSVKRPRGRPV
jgi:molybdopterin molybdotransferase